MAEEARMRERRYVAAASCWGALLAHALGMTMFGPLVTVIEAQFAITRLGTSFLWLVLAISFLPAVLAGRRLVERWGDRNVLAWGCFGLAGGLVGFSLSGRLAAGVASLVLVGLAGGALQIGANSAVARLFPVNRTLHMNLLHLFFGIGAISGPRLLAGILDAGLPWSRAYWIAASVAGLAGVLALLRDLGCAPEGGTLQRRSPAVAGDGAGSPAPAGAVMSGGSSLLHRERAIRHGVLFMALYVGAEVSLSVWGPAYMEEELGLAKGVAAAGLSDFWLAMTVGRFLCVPLARLVRGSVLLVGLATGGFLSITLFARGAAGVATPALLVAGLFFSGIFPTMFALLGDRFPNSIPRITGLVMTAAAVGNLVIPWLVGLCASLLGQRAAMLAVAALMGLVVVLALRAGRAQR
jgi:fucose permease